MSDSPTKNAVCLRIHNRSRLASAWSAARCLLARPRVGHAGMDECDTRQSDQKKALIHLSHAFRRSCSVEANTHWEITSGVSRFRSCRVDQFEGIMMCGRYVRRSDKQRIAELFAVHGPVIPDFGPSWNVAPQSFQPVVRLNRDTGEREIVLMRWGLIPFWAKDPKIGLRTINAKAETIVTAPAFREAIRYRRCLVPADAFYEWQRISEKVKAAIRNCFEIRSALCIRRSLGEVEGCKGRCGASDVYPDHHRPERTRGAHARPHACDHSARRI